VTSVATVRVVDSHTEGEATRVVIDGAPELTGATMPERVECMRATYDRFRSGIVREPRGHDAIVGAVLTPPVSPASLCGVIFFNDVGYLGMCGHGLMGVMRTLVYLGRVTPGEVSVDTPVGPVSARIEHDGPITIRNVPAYSEQMDLTVDVSEVGAVTGDIAWGGNWFFITPWDLSANRSDLLALSQAIRTAVQKHDPRVDHLELVGAPTRSDADSRNFVLCPGVAYDRSPCGTGTSAKLATLHDRGKLAVGERWRQESITGSLFTAWLERMNGDLIPHIQGRAFITAESTLRFEEGDPFRWGIPA
jgi:4-hydroxyproline epimerase